MRNSYSASFRRKLLMGISAAAMMAPAVGALAQDEAVDEIVVTVERREQSLQDYAGTAAQISGEDLKALGIANMADLDGAIPGLNITNNQGNIEVWIRGVGSSNSTELGDPAAATHLNGVYVPRPAGFGSAFFDIERVEVNFGPQGTLRGRNAMAGSVDAIAFKPGLGVTDGSIELGAGSKNEATTQGVLNLAVTDNSAARFAFFASERDSLYTNRTPDPLSLDDNPTVVKWNAPYEGWNNVDRPVNGRLDDRRIYDLAEREDKKAHRLSYYIEPTDTLDLTFVYDEITENGSGYTGTNFAALANDGIDFDSIDDGREVISAFGHEPSEVIDHSGVKIEANLETAIGSFEFITSARDMERTVRATSPLRPYYEGVLDDVNYDNSSTLEHYDNYSHYNLLSKSESSVNELRFESNEASEFGLPLSWTAGLFHFTEEQRTATVSVGDRVEQAWNMSHGRQTTDDGGEYCDSPGNNCYQNFANFAMTEFNTFTDSESWAAYIDGTYEIDSETRLSAGLRYTDEEKERYGISSEIGFVLYNNSSGNNVPDGHGGRLGTSGFEIAGFDRAIYNPDTDSSGTIDQVEMHNYFFDGIARFGLEDTIDNTFSGGPAAGGWQDASFVNLDPAQAATGLQWGTTTPIIYMPELMLQAIENGTQPGMCVTTTALSQTDNCYPNFAINGSGQIDFANSANAKGTPYYHNGMEYTGNFAIQNGRMENDFVDWRVRLEKDLAPDWLVYGLVATGNKAGGFNDNLPVEAGTTALPDSYQAIAPDEFDATTQAPIFDSESVTYFEVGSKQELTYQGVDLKLNASAFMYDYSDMVISTVMTTGAVLDLLNVDRPSGVDLGKMVQFSFNTEGADIFGLHFDIGAELPYGVNMNSQLVLMDTEINTNGSVFDSRYSAETARSIDGNDLPRAPKTQLKVDLSQALTTVYGQFDWIASFGFKSEAYSTVFNAKSYGESYGSYTVDQNAARLDGKFGDYWTIDAGIGFVPANRDNVKIEAFVKNLTDEHESVFSLITANDHIRWFNGPRSVGVRVRANF